jgi:hypothetical protein
MEDQATPSTSWRVQEAVCERLTKSGALDSIRRKASITAGRAGLAAAIARARARAACPKCAIRSGVAPPAPPPSPQVAEQLRHDVSPRSRRAGPRPLPEPRAPRARTAQPNRAAVAAARGRKRPAAPHATRPPPAARARGRRPSTRASGVCWTSARAAPTSKALTSSPGRRERTWSKRPRPS